jgi:hypothetical protein
MSALNNALELAAQGYPVFSARLCPDVCLKCNICKTPACPHGFKDASSDPDQVRQLWKLYPGQAIGVPTGDASGFDVLDVDCIKHPEAANWWLSHRQYIPYTRVHQTGSGGLHVLFQHSGLARTGNGRLGTGIDVKANGGYIVWWPTHRKVELSPGLLSVEQPLRPGGYRGIQQHAVAPAVLAFAGVWLMLVPVSRTHGIIIVLQCFKSHRLYREDVGKIETRVRHFWRRGH